MNDEVSEKNGGRSVIGLNEVGESRYELIVEGETVHVDAAKSGRTIYSVIEDGQQFEAMVDEKGEHGFDVLLAGHLFHFEALDERTRLLSGSAEHVAEGKQVVEADMPGKAVKICVQVGESVSEGQGVVIVEAMKMENEIASPIGGIVTEIGVSEGDTVEPGSLLFIVDPPGSGGSGDVP